VHFDCLNNLQLFEQESSDLQGGDDTRRRQHPLCFHSYM
jgi:hypothetical protein